MRGTSQHREEATGRGEEEASLKLHLEINGPGPADSRSLISVVPHMAAAKEAGWAAEMERLPLGRAGSPGGGGGQGRGVN